MTSESDTPSPQDVKTAKRKWWELSGYSVNMGQLIFGVLGVILAAAALWLSYQLYPRYGLQVVTLSRSSLTNIASELSGDIQVLYQGKPVPNLVLVQTKMENIGNQPVRKQDFDQPLEFIFPEGTEALTAKVIDSRKVDFPPALSPISNTVYVEPHLLNPEARLVLQFVVAGVANPNEAITYTVRSSIANIGNVIPIDAVESGTSGLSPTSREFWLLIAVALVLSFIGNWVYTSRNISRERFRATNDLDQRHLEVRIFAAELERQRFQAMTEQLNRLEELNAKQAAAIEVLTSQQNVDPGH